MLPDNEQHKARYVAFLRSIEPIAILWGMILLGIAYHFINRITYLIYISR